MPERDLHLVWGIETLPRPELRGRISVQLDLFLRSGFLFTDPGDLGNTDRDRLPDWIIHHKISAPDDFAVFLVNTRYRVTAGHFA